MENPVNCLEPPNVKSREISSQAINMEGSEISDFHVESSDSKRGASQVDDDMIQPLSKDKAVYVCRECGKPKILPDDFYGHNRKCKECVKYRVSVWQKSENGKESHRNALSKWNKKKTSKQIKYKYKLTDKGREAEKKYRRSLLDRHPEKIQARRLVRKAIKDGILVRPDTCSKCNQVFDKIEAHHSDYSKPLEVDWLCYPCHKDEHESSESC